MGEEVITMAYVKVDENEPLEKSIKRFKRMVEKEGIIREWKKREYYEKPSTIQKASSASGRSVSTTRSPLPSRTARTRLLRASR